VKICEPSVPAAGRRAKDAFTDEGEVASARAAKVGTISILSTREPASASKT